MKYLNFETAYPVDSAKRVKSESILETRKTSSESYIVTRSCGKTILRKSEFTSSKWDSEKRCWID